MNCYVTDAREPLVWVKVTVDMNEYRHMEDPAFKLHFRVTTTRFEVI